MAASQAIVHNDHAWRPTLDEQSASLHHVALVPPKASCCYCSRNMAVLRAAPLRLWRLRQPWTPQQAWALGKSREQLLHSRCALALHLLPCRWERLSSASAHIAKFFVCTYPHAQYKETQLPQQQKPERHRQGWGGVETEPLSKTAASPATPKTRKLVRLVSRCNSMQERHVGPLLQQFRQGRKPFCNRAPACR